MPRRRFDYAIAAATPLRHFYAIFAIFDYAISLSLIFRQPSFFSSADAILRSFFFAMPTPLLRTAP
jgi:hypothetical protein